MEFNQLQDMLNQARDNSADTRDAIYILKQKLASIQRQKNTLNRDFDPNNESHLQRIDALNIQEKTLAASLSEQKNKLSDAGMLESARLEAFSTFSDPRINLPNLDDSYPILLLPLRLETRFKAVKQPGAADIQQQLWIRVFPDDIAIDTFEATLSKDELRNAKSYWLAMWKAADNEAEQRGAWRSLMASHGSGRAYWITQTFLPLNQPEKPDHKDAKEIILVIGSEVPLSSEEKPVVLKFWELLWRAADNIENQMLAKRFLVGALRELRIADIELRADEIQAQYLPINLFDPPPPETTHTTARVTVAVVEFPDTLSFNVKQQSWSLPPTVNVLPERLVVQGFYRGVLDIDVMGEPIGSPLIVGPDPSAKQGESLNLQGDDLEVNKDIKWLIDFDEAVAKGMGFKINLSPDQARRGFDRLFVVGVRMSANVETGQKLLENLFEHHHYSRKGMRIIRQGTPTNNTENASGYAWREDADVSFSHYFIKANQDATAADWTTRTDGQWLVECLGINPTKLSAIENYMATDQSDAKAMNIALWPATLGYFMQSMMAPVFSDEEIKHTREFFTQFVSGRGILPAIRIGNQPYGILPTTTFSRMVWLKSKERDTGFTHVASAHAIGGSFLFQLHAVLKKFDEAWEVMRREVSYVGKDENPHISLLNIIGLHPGSVEIHSRYLQSLEHLFNLYNLIGLALNQDNSFASEKYSNDGINLLESFGYQVNDKNDIPEILSKFFFKTEEKLLGKLIDEALLSETDPLSVHTIDNKNYIEWLINAARTSHDALRKQQGFINNTPPTALLYLLLQHSLDLSFIDTSLNLHERHNIMSKDVVAKARIEPLFIHIEQEADKGSRWQHIYKSEPIITGSPTMLISDYISAQLGFEPETQGIEEMLEALSHLKKQPTAKLERALMEHLDTCSYRYDAWMQGLVNYQLQHMRNINANKSNTVESKPAIQGIFLGAYGWLEEVRPKDNALEELKLAGELKEKFQREQDAPLVKDSSNGGYILAPSLNHAVTAAVLRNGYISNRETPAAKPFAINLSSERVRQALNIIEGIRAGQSLGALLGYQLERGLHDRHDTEVDEFIFDLRKAFPLQANQLQSTKTAEHDSIEQIEARNVINGLALIEHIEARGVSTYPFAADLPLSATPEQRTAINAEVQRIIDINDAVADLALAEGVHQVVQGNYDRAAAVLDSYSKGHLPPTPDVIKTPRSGITITQRVGLQFKTGLDPADPANTTPRSKAEPALNDWLKSILPSEIACLINFFDHDTNSVHEEVVTTLMLELEPIDLLYLLNTTNEQSMSALDDIIHRYIILNFSPRPDAEIKIQYTKPVLGKVTLFELTPLIDSLRTLVLQSRSLNAGDVKPMGEAKKSDEDGVFIDPKRIMLLVDELNNVVALPTPESSPLQSFVNTITPLVNAKDVDNLIQNIDLFIDDLSGLFSSIGRFGLPQTGIGFLYDWRRRTFSALITKVEALKKRLEGKLKEYRLLMANYELDWSDFEKISLLQKAERLITSSSSFPIPFPEDYYSILESIQRPAFERQLERIRNLLKIKTLSNLFQEITTEALSLVGFDLVGINIEEERKQVLIFASDIKINAENLNKNINQRLADVDTLLTTHAITSAPKQQVQLLTEAAKIILHEDFKLIPEFLLSRKQADEWVNALDNSEQLLRYLNNEQAIDFPIDDWLHGAARVRGKMHHVENAALFIEGMTSKNLLIQPIQLPYRQYDYWLAMLYPDKIAETDKPFAIDEDKLLYNAIYAETFDKTKPQCGLLVDEWTEVIPIPETTVGLTFHYDQPNTEPPQTLLLVTPSDFKGAWQWQNLVDTLHETLDMAKKRAVEPEQIDEGNYGPFLPAVVSAVTAYPITAALTFSLNNRFHVIKKGAAQ